MKLTTAERLKNWLWLCLSNLRTDKSADIKLIGKFEGLCANIDGIISNLKKDTETKTETKNNG